MAKVKAEVVRCIFDGKTDGEVTELDEGIARKYESLGYLRNIQPVKKASAPKKPAKKAETKTDK